MFPYSKPRLPIIFGPSGPTLTHEEEDFWCAYPPLGFILFSRNIKSETQVRELTQALTALVGEARIPILIDEEGGNVSRLSALSKGYTTCAIEAFEKASLPPKLPLELCHCHYTRISLWLNNLGFTVNCAPVLDVRSSKTAYFLRSRCFSEDPTVVSELGKIAIHTMKAYHITPVMKHLPGHGSAILDSHHELPYLEEITDTDLYPFFKQEECWAMTSHIVFSKFDEKPVTFSSRILQDVIRKKLQFKGFLITDDLYMGALSKFSLKERVQCALQAGHDSVLLCHGNPKEWEVIVKEVPFLSQESQGRLKNNI